MVKKPKGTAGGKRKTRKEIQPSTHLHYRMGLDTPASKISAGVEMVHSPLDRCNGTEKRYFEEHIKSKLEDGTYVDWTFEAIGFRLGYKQTYWPDFVLIDSEGKLSVHEVKGGYIYPDAWEKLKFAAAFYPRIPFYLCQYKGKQWEISRIPKG